MLFQMFFIVIIVPLAQGQNCQGIGKEEHTSKECIPLNVSQNQTSQPTTPTFDAFFSQFSLDAFFHTKPAGPFSSY